MEEEIKLYRVTSWEDGDDILAARSPKEALKYAQSQFGSDFENFLPLEEIKPLDEIEMKEKVLDGDTHTEIGTLKDVLEREIKAGNVPCYISSNEF